jgi:hypothetical protein
VTVTDPLYRTFDQYLAGTTERERRAWCQMKAKRANRPRLMSGVPDVKLTADAVLNVFMEAQGRCAHCGSLAVENRPSNDKGHPMPWDAVGRRIGSLDHSDTRVGGGSNAAGNMRWACLWCNTWPNQRIPGATDHGGIQDETLPAVQAAPPRLTEQQKAEFMAGYAGLSPEQRATLAARQQPAQYDPFNADHWAEITDPDDPDYLRGTAMGRD